MRHALALGARGLGQTWPNPAVGCVLVQGARIVGRGWTQPGGRPHAEVVALRQAGAAAAGATAYVTLEPCAHHGKTPPCAEALIASGVRRVVTALTDPDPRVAGRGHALLRAAGIEVTEGLLSTEAWRANLGFLTRVREGRPMVTLKLASSLDGRIATASGESRWITGPEARRVVHALRLSHDAVLVGAGTARADDPLLTVRGLGAVHQPLRLIAARGLDLPADGQLAQSAARVPLWLLHDPEVAGPRMTTWHELGARLIPVRSGADGQLDPRAMLAALGDAGVTRVFCEGGGALSASLLSAGLVDHLITFSAGLAIGAEGRPAIGALGVAALADAPRFRLRGIRQVGTDVMQLWDRV
ncbi:MAG: bifunctional diaminohydroxyphosphoribosylaminopyrimidine deaminase/5-amino-6-(5-phosphoribosylamino)uracil reductase RibD [Paracoccaceae bacterium]|nr:bifunctional diaminohydroxyphosphoribosylaminopyrimidine deaminase/5-amino-6-(5-phosphoribosylamino)uracil reductase RibD [Paracoccaceae bacterium]MDE3239451.1 bifunctional diaminohydroxyphosphoribosylaminopyrimidine deaminase/5-amino-6-(5-phosphoribosylamino)uracil reductase RibD [Paracoccaceae bacterium]